MVVCVCVCVFDCVSCVIGVGFDGDGDCDCREYLDRICLYRKRCWTCKVTGKINLTFEEALMSERRAIEKVQQFPTNLVAPVLREVQFSMSSLSPFYALCFQWFVDLCCFILVFDMVYVWCWASFLLCMGALWNARLC